MHVSTPTGETRERRSFPMVGDVLPFLRDKTGFLRRCHLQFGDQIRLQIGRPVWLLNDPADVGHVLAGNARNYHKSPKLSSDRGRALSGCGLHTATGEEHLFMRRSVQPLFTRKAVDRHAVMINRLAGHWFKYWSALDSVELFGEMMRLSQQVMLRALLGESFDDRRKRFAGAVTDRRAYIEHFFASNLPRPEIWPLPVVYRYRRARKLLHSRLQQEIERRRSRPPAGADFLSMLLAATDRNGLPLPETRVVDEALTITSTGYETVGAALTWTIHLLAAHPEWQQAVATEIEALAPAGDLDATTVDRLKTTRRVLDEALRLYPPTWLFIRSAVEADTLPSGTPLAPGEEIYLCPWTMHRHPGWYPDPERFDPDRFLDEPARSRPRWTYFPFGSGSRQCIGEPFARLEAMILLAHMVRSFEFRPFDQRPPALRPGIVLEPLDGLRVRIRVR